MSCANQRDSFVVFSSRIFLGKYCGQTFFIAAILRLFYFSPFFLSALIFLFFSFFLSFYFSIIISFLFFFFFSLHLFFSSSFSVGTIRLIVLQIEENTLPNVHLVRAISCTLITALKHPHGPAHVHTVSYILKEITSFLCRLRSIEEIRESPGTNGIIIDLFVTLFINCPQPYASTQ